MSRSCSIGIGVALAAIQSLCPVAWGYAECGEQLAKLLADDGADVDIFGGSVSVSGYVAVIGASWDDDNGINSGSAYVFRWDGVDWRQEQQLLPDDGARYAEFGTSVSVSGDVTVIGAIGDDDYGEFSGSAYVFRWDGVEWVQVQKLLPGDGAPFDYFGSSVSVSGDVAVIGSSRDDDNGDASGAAYVFRWDGAEWIQSQKLLPDDGAPGDFFGSSVSISGDVAVVAAIFDDDNGWNAGSAYVFRRDGAEWRQEGKLLSADGAREDWFGNSVSVSRDVAVIGAWRDDDNGSDSGSAYLFRWDGVEWRQDDKLLPDDGASDDQFGWSVSVSEDVAVIGATLDDDNGEWSGSAYVFRWDGEEWRQAQQLLADDGVPEDRFGRSVCVSGDVAVIGATGDDDNGPFSGSAYVFDVGSCGTCVRDPEWQCDGDVDGDGQVNPVDAGLVQAAFGSGDDQDLCNYDLDCDGQINPVDAGIVQSLFGTCEAARDVCP